MKVQMIDLDKIEQNDNSRVVYKTIDLSELMMSMKKNGLLEPVGVRPLGGGKYDAIFGNRRIVAAKKLGWTEIPAHIMDIDSEIDRDILGLLENMKRQNTSVAEDGRMFKSLQDRGMSESEIASRLEIPLVRVKTAIDVITEIPAEYRKRIVYRTPGQRKLTDRISASTALAILTVKKNAGLNREQTRSLMDHASKNTPTIQQLNKIAPLIKSGFSIAEAIERSSELESVSVEVYMYSKDVDALVAKHKKSIRMILRDYLMENKAFKIQDPEKKLTAFRRKTTHNTAEVVAS